MANRVHLRRLKQGVVAWNQWRNEHLKGMPDLRGADLSDANLAGADLEGSNLSGANLTRANLSGANLRQADLTRANLSEADLRPAILPPEYLRPWDHITADPGQADPIGADLSFLADLSGASLILKPPWLRQAYLTRANLSGADLSEADLSGAKLAKAFLGAANLSGANLGGANFNGADLCQADLSGANFNGANLRQADLSRANFNGANLRQADLSGANLSRAHRSFYRDFSGANLAYWPDLSEADLSGANLSEADLSGANLRGANLSGANLRGADLRAANLSGADLRGADLVSTLLVETNFKEANLTGCSVYGISAWNVNLTEADQTNLVITHRDEPVITVDNLEVAQFIYLLLHNEKIRQVIDTITSKAVLILGRFTPERKAVLDAIREALRQRNYLPILFDFERPTDRDFTETIMTLAGMCLFIIADITNPKSSPLELQATVPNYMVPFVPIIQEGEQPFAMFKDLRGKFDWVLDPLTYDSTLHLISGLEEAIIKPALKKHDELLARKVGEIQTRHIKDYL